MFLAEKEMSLFKPILSVDDRCLTTKSPLFPYGFHLFAVKKSSLYQLYDEPIGEDSFCVL